LEEYHRYFERLKQRGPAIAAGSGSIRSFPVLERRLKKDKAEVLRLQDVARDGKLRDSPQTEKRVAAARIARDKYSLLEAESRGRMVSGIKSMLKSMSESVFTSASETISAIARAEAAIEQLDLDEQDTKLESLRAALAELEK
jgi:hypothetical protein